MNLVHLQREIIALAFMDAGSYVEGYPAGGPMRASPLWLLALFPWVSEPPAHAPVTLDTRVPAGIAIEVQVEAPLAVGTVDFSVTTGDIDRAWVPYGLTLCWRASPRGCEGLELHVRVFGMRDALLALARVARSFSWISN